MSQSTALVPSRPAFALRQHLRQQAGLPFADCLPAAVIHKTFRGLGRDFRERVFTPAVTLWTFLSQVLDADHSCRQAVARLLAFRTAQGLRPCSPETSAYCKARGRLPESLLRELTRRTGRELQEQAPPAWLWKGRPVKLVDGTGLSMPDSARNQKAYPKSKKLAPGVGFPLVRLVVVFSLAVGTVLEAALGPFHGKGNGELSLWRKLQDTLQRGEVLVADRLYPTFWVVADALARGADVVMRMHAGRAAVWFRGRGHRTDNRRICWQKPQRPRWMTAEQYERIPQWLQLRAVRVDVRQPGFRTKRLLLVTTLTDAEEVTGADLAELYRRRWQAELYLRSLKTTLQMDVLRGKSPAIVRKEIWAHLLVYNLVRTVMAQAAAAAPVRPDQISFTGALQTLNAFLPQMHAAQTSEDAQALWEVLLWAVGEHRVGNRPDRYEPRAVKRRAKNYPRLREPREQARQRLRQRAKRVGKKR
jgi:Transposase DDE domain/Insertion element 4 transposase N-terminal